MTDIPHLYYFGAGGKLVPEIAGLTIAHELIHNLLGLGDNVVGTELQMNGASWDFLGDTVRLQNQIADEAGYWDNGQTNYQQAMMDSWAIFSEFQTGFSYSSDREVSISRYGTAGADLIDHSNRTDDSNDLLFGLAGVDTIKGGTGDDSLWGGTANDVLEGGDGDDLLSGDGGSDSIDGGAGTDIVSYELRPISHGGAARSCAHGGGATATRSPMSRASSDPIIRTRSALPADGCLDHLGQGRRRTSHRKRCHQLHIRRAGIDTISGGDGDDALGGGIGDA